MKSLLRWLIGKRGVSTLGSWRDDYLSSKRVRLEEKTLGNYRRVINLYIEFVGEEHWPPTRFDVIRFLDDVQERASQTTTYSYWAILRAWFNYLAKVGAFGRSQNPAEQIEQLELAPHNPKKMPKGIPRQHMDLLLEYLQSLPEDLTNLRDLALIQFLYHTGARAGEAALLTREVLQLELNQVNIEAEVAKDDEDRQIFFGKKVRVILETWLSVLADSGYEGIWVFPSTRGNRALDQPLTVSGIYQMFHRRLEKVDLPKYRVHDLRHTFTKIAIRRKIALSSIQRQLGHSTPDMVLRYAKAFSEDQKIDFINFGDGE